MSCLPACSLSIADLAAQPRLGKRGNRATGHQPCLYPLQVLTPLMQLRCVTAPLLYSMDLRWHVGGASSAACHRGGSGGGGSSGGGDGGGSGCGSDGGSTQGFDDGGRESAGSRNRIGSGGSGTGDGGAATLWVAAGTVFLDVLTWTGPTLALAMLRSRAAAGVYTAWRRYCASC